MNEAGRNITEAVGGMWQGLNQPEPTFVPLDEFISKKMLEEIEAGTYNPEDLVLEQAAYTVDA